MFRFWSLCIGYIFGCFSTAYVVTRFKQGTDIREIGSGNAGAANVAAQVGKSAGWITILGDAAKTFVAVIICTSLFIDKTLATIYAGTGAVLGHDWPFWARFKGGKGVVCTVATMVCFGPVTALGSLGVFGLSTALILRHWAVVGVVITIAGCAALTAIAGYPWECVALALLLGCIGAYQLRDNIAAARRGTQEKFTFTGMFKKLFGPSGTDKH